MYPLPFLLKNQKEKKKRMKFTIMAESKGETSMSHHGEVGERENRKVPHTFKQSDIVRTHSLS